MDIRLYGYLQGYMTKEAQPGDPAAPQGPVPPSGPTAPGAPMGDGKASTIDSAIQKAQAEAAKLAQEANDAAVLANAAQAKLDALMQGQQSGMPVQG